jgi:hypothetical protein
VKDALTNGVCGELVHTQGRTKQHLQYGRSKYRRNSHTSTYSHCRIGEKRMNAGQSPDEGVNSAKCLALGSFFLEPSTTSLALLSVMNSETAVCNERED